jgi:Sulfotransferase family
MSPVFIFGTGRCGSTHLQRLISLRTTCWIWGEHDGFLAPLLGSVQRYERSQPLSRNVFPRSAETDAQLIEHVTTDSAALSWLNRLSDNTLRTKITALVEELFRSRLPKGWSEWGFKEILYGLNNDWPSVLLELFPTANAAFSFRNPKATITSMMLTWSPQIARDPLDVALIQRIYQERTERWRKIVTYFLSLKEKSSDRIVFLRADLLDGNEAAILDVLRLERRNDLYSALPLGRTYPGPRARPSAVMELMDRLYSDVEEEFKELYERANAACRDDLRLSQGASTAGAAEGAPD